MQYHLDQLVALHLEITVALDAGDVERVLELVNNRQVKLTALEHAYKAATEPERQHYQAALKEMQSEEFGLLQRCVDLRDELYSELAAGHRRTRTPDHVDVKGSLDCQA